MKARLFSITLFLAFALSMNAEPIKIGDNLETTLEQLGKPMGTIELRDKTLLLYPQGEITLKNDKVSDVDLMDDAEFEADQERLRIEREEWLAQKAKLDAERIENGKQIKAAKISSSAFAALPAKDRVDYWRSFQIRFPEIDVSEEIGTALQSYQVELAELKSQHQIAELEARIAVAEKEAAEARLEAEKARDEATAQRRVDSRRFLYYTDPVVNRPYYYCPPTVTIHSNGSVNTTHGNTTTKRYFNSTYQPKVGVRSVFDTN
ncbi:MAG: hypothetical protein ACSHX8_13460 [Opitutaceae bacterium]